MLNSMHPFAALDQPPTMDIKARKELADAASSCASFLTIELENPYNAFVWKAVMKGPVGSPYHGADLHMRVVFGGQGDSSQTPMVLPPPLFSASLKHQRTHRNTCAPGVYLLLLYATVQSVSWTASTRHKSLTLTSALRLCSPCLSKSTILTCVRTERSCSIQSRF